MLDFSIVYLVKGKKVALSTFATHNECLRQQMWIGFHFKCAISITVYRGIQKHLAKQNSTTCAVT